MEIRLGGIYALERISTESEEDYWPIMEILNAYIRQNSSIETEEVKKNKVSMDIQAVLTVIRRREDPANDGKYISFDLQKTYLREANLEGTNLENSNLEDAYLERANPKEAKNLTIDQLSNVKTFYNAELDEELFIP